MHPNRPFASVLLPADCPPEQLVRALRGLLEQEETSWEALVVDCGDGSAAALALALHDPRIVALRNPGLGKVAARNVAIGSSRGTVLCWLEDSDWWDDPRHLTRLRAAADAGPALWYRGGWLVVPTGAGEKAREPYGFDVTPASLSAGNPILSSSVAYPRVVQRVLGPLDESLGAYAGWDMLLRLAGHGLPFRRLDGPGVCVAVHGAGSATHGDPERHIRFARFREKHGLAAPGAAADALEPPVAASAA